MKTLHLISDGIDSITAAHILEEKGYEIEFIHFSFGTEELKKTTVEKIKKLIKKLSRKNNKEYKLHIIDYNKFQNEKIKNNKIHCILCKRTMLKTAEKLSKEIGDEFISNGDNLGQVASQTLKNIEVIDEGINKIILRPLLVMDKTDIIKIAREIGTYEISIQNAVRCPYLPKRAATRANLDEIKKAEKEIQIEKLIEEMIKTEKVETIKA